jgi:hydrogenase expression/formation protein HypE
MTPPYHFTTIVFDLETALLQPAPEGRARGGPRMRPGAAGVCRKALAAGLLLAVYSRSGARAARALLAQAIRPSGVRPAFVILSTRPGVRGNPFTAAARATAFRPARSIVVSADPAVLRLAGAAGAATVLLGGRAADLPPTDFRIDQLSGLDAIVRMGLPLPAGKLPNDLLRALLSGFRFEDPSLLIDPAVGEDIAAVDVSPEEVLVLKSDPITFATDAIGRYAVLVNANDIATSGATPRWLLTTLLFPVGSTPSRIASVVHDLEAFCRAWGVTLCGGHTEITDAVTRPVVAGMMAGTVARRRLIDKRTMRPGDHLLMTKGAGVEGTAIIARELAPRLRRSGMSAAEIRRCRDFLDRVSIIPEARRAAEMSGTSAMHDITEGGVATAVEELGAAGGCRLRVHIDRIPVYPETRRICRLLGIHPFGLIGSGGLLICCRPGAAGKLQRRIEADGIEVARIGEVTRKGTGVEALRNGRAARWPRFAVDEIARLFAGL